MKLFTSSLISTALLISFSSSAELINKDLDVTGDRLAALDTETGLHWMDLSQTKSLSVNDVQLELEAGGKYDGWRFATANEVLTLMNSELGDGYDTISDYNTNGSFSTSNEYYAAKNIINKLGVTYTSWGKNYIKGVIADPLSDSLLMGSLSAWTSVGSLYGNFSVSGTNVTADQSNNKQSVWLVSDDFTSPSDVPLPAGLAFLSLSFLLLNPRRVQKQK